MYSFVVTFYKDVVLLDYGAETSPSKLQAVQTGRACCMVPFSRQLTEEEVEKLIDNSFESQLMTLHKPRYFTIICQANIFS